jgi:hypothetical protein
MDLSKEHSMSLYPSGHHPFLDRGLQHDDRTAHAIHCIAEETSLSDCLNAAYMEQRDVRHQAEMLRAELFRAEHLCDTQRLPDRPDLFVALPHEIPILLESLKAAQRCLEEWLESEACQAILFACRTSKRYHFGLQHMLNRGGAPR